MVLTIFFNERLSEKKYQHKLGSQFFDYLLCISKYFFMKQNSEHLQDLSEIRKMMETSSKFISLSGLSGVFPGIFAIIGAGLAYWKQYQSQVYFSLDIDNPVLHFFVADALAVLVLSIVAAFYFTWQRSQQKNQQIWNNTSKRLLASLSIPLLAGGFFCLLLLIYAPLLVPSATLIFYGLALINASRYTLDDIKYLGLCEILLGMICGIFAGGGLNIVFWAIGFGVLHIIYGTLMYNKYEA